MTTYTLTKGTSKTYIRISEDKAEVTHSIGGNVSTSMEVLTPTEGNRRVTELLRQGYSAQRSGKKK